MLDCARAVPLWSGAMNPFVLAASVVAGGSLLDLSNVDHREVAMDGMRHILLRLPAGPLQLDLLDADDRSGAFRIRPSIDLARPVEPQAHSVRRLAALVAGAPEPASREAKVRRLVAALRVGDALADGASQRDIGLGIFGDDWPGDGEHLKSRVRRMIPFAAELVRVGPQGVLQARI
jgi:hypothetical protein